MPTYYCNSSTCGAAITYSVVKPPVCPKCGKNLKAAVVTAKVVPVPVTSPSVTFQAAEDDDAPLVAPIRRTRPEPKHISRARIMEDPVTEFTDTEGDSGTEGREAPEDDILDKCAARKLARELLATIDPNTIHIGSEDDDKPIKFGDLLRQREAQQGQ